MIKELDQVVLTADIPEEGLRAGDVGTVVHIHKGHKAGEVEFFTLAGDTVAVATARTSQIRHIRKSDIHHARKLATA
jgi:hypothetical protein